MGPSTIMTVLNAEDWGVMKMMIKITITKKKKEESEEDDSDKENVDVSGSETYTCVKEEEELVDVTGSEEEEDDEEDDEEAEKEKGKRVGGESENPPQEKRPRIGIQFNDVNLAKTKTVLGATWPSTTTSTGKWFTQASQRSTKHEGK